MPAPASESPQVSATTIGGIVGGIGALLLCGGLIALIVARNRRNGSAGQRNETAGAQLQSASHSNYGPVPVVANPPPNRYSELAVSPPDTYDAWSDSNYGDGQIAQLAPNHSNRYVDFSTVH